MVVPPRRFFPEWKPKYAQEEDEKGKKAAGKRRKGKWYTTSTPRVSVTEVLNCSFCSSLFGLFSRNIILGE